ncbi:ABC transporter substrate-binding protein [Shimia thalassica]|uniref:Putative phospholipid-binding protein MlaC n=1 Tax=Shimia thalassica TaxID=1715693 RepID=A0A0P1INR8_9RHOB|nr:ABC transporter substrate-binding protein [Shimia thalassica]PHO04659.1 ABC transporter [Rhodobacteraceae bacterium 4F10]MDO6484436.1 ABC transporter substrate-binding protein [Shimia thalassica]MDO6521932.1 ABC transporter substrate-binding protein [Shimia thalassica]MDO6797628.1 ABC transporter substrate-binding protein [Shimia thalassica]MDP2493550.1 ABC transporter substrate-binding protein [Shimia thalassica]
MKRREFLGAVSASALVALLPSGAFALTDAQAKSLVDKAVADINKVISSGKSLNSMIRDFERIFVKYADVPVIARSALGADARRASSAQLSAYTKAFQSYIARKYGKRFEEFVGGHIEVKDARKVKSFHEVQSIATLRGEAPFSVNFLVSDKSGKPRFFDMIIEGISLRLSEKEEIGAMLDKRKGNIDLLTQDLKKAG